MHVRVRACFQAETRSDRNVANSAVDFKWKPFFFFAASFLSTSAISKEFCSCKTSEAQ